MCVFRRLSVVQKTISELERELSLRVLCFLRESQLRFDSRIRSIFQHVECIVDLTVNNLHNVNASLTWWRRHVSSRILWKRSFFCNFVYCVIVCFQMHDAFQSVRNSLRQIREREERCLFLIRRRANVNVALSERRFYCNYWM